MVESSFDSYNNSHTSRYSLGSLAKNKDFPFCQVKAEVGISTSILIGSISAQLLAERY